MHTKMKKFPVSVPDDLHRRFKIKCAIEGVMMSEVVRRLLERECKAIGETNSCPLRASRQVRPGGDRRIVNNRRRRYTSG